MDDSIDDDDDDDSSDGSSAGSDPNAEESDGASENAEETKQSSLKTGSKRERGNQSRKPEISIKVPKLSKGKLYKPPTNEELNQLKETENLFHSTLFRMQVWYI